MPMSQHETWNIILGLFIIAVQLIVIPFGGFSIWSVLAIACGIFLILVREPK